MRTVVIFPGRFQPFHRGHLATFKSLGKKFQPEDVYIATSDSQAPGTSPFSFGDKQLMMVQQGVNPQHILQIKRPYNIKEITDLFGTDDIAVVFAVSDKDRERIVKLLSNEYYEPYPDNGRVKSIKNNGRAYVLATPVVPFKLAGINTEDASKIREKYINTNRAGQDQILEDLFNTVDSNIRDIFDRKLAVTKKVEEFVNEARRRPSAKKTQLVERVLQLELALKEEEEPRISLSSSERAKHWINKVYQLYPATFDNNHVMLWGEGDDQQFAMFELVPSMSRRDAVEIKWFMAYPLRQGVGSRAMAELQRLAQEDGIALTLYPWDKGRVSQSKLMKFYRGHGFRPTARGSKSMAWEPVKENDDNLFAPQRHRAEVFADFLHDNGLESHQIVGPKSLVDALTLTKAPYYLLRLVRQLDHEEQVDLVDSIADIMWHRWDQHRWEPEDDPGFWEPVEEPRLDENDDDLFEPSVRSRILKLLTDRMSEVKSMAYNDPTYDMREYLQELYMSYRDYMKMFNKDWNQALRELYLDNVPFDLVDDIVTTFEDAGINLTHWAPPALQETAPDYVEEARTISTALAESSGYSLEGSVTPDLVHSKLWLLNKLADIQPEISTLYVLGAWYGNLAMLAAKLGRPEIDHIINVESDKKFLETSKKILDHMGVDNVEYMLRDANDLDYRQVDDNSVVVNTSLTDMPGRRWFDRIPPGTVTVLQARDHDPGAQFHSTEDILKKFPMSEILYQGTADLEDPETEYTRYMVIGRR